MKALFCCANTLRRELGGPKIQMELVEELRLLGWRCDLLGKEEIIRNTKLSYSENLRNLLKEISPDYDLVEYEHHLLPYPRSEFSSTTLMVARASLLAHHYLRIKLPESAYWLDRWRKWIRGGILNPEQLKRGVDLAQTTMESSDLVNVGNQDDRIALLESGIPSEKILVQPYGLSRESMDQLGSLASGRKHDLRVAFIGTFDVRKGSSELSVIIKQTIRDVPGACFRLLGTAGEFQTSEEVLRRLPSMYRSKIEVIPRYSSEELPKLLSDCAVGIFPTYLESFGFAALEMMRAALPVVAYKAPGPRDFVPEDWLVEPGDVAGLVGHLKRWLLDETFRTKEGERARELAGSFTWTKVAESTSFEYKQRILELKKNKA